MDTSLFANLSLAVDATLQSYKVFCFFTYTSWLKLCQINVVDCNEFCILSHLPISCTLNFMTIIISFFLSFFLFETGYLSFAHFINVDFLNTQIFLRYNLTNNTQPTGSWLKEYGLNALTEHHAMKECWGSGCIVPRILDLALDWGERSTSRLGCLPPGKELLVPIG
jgi:hypothetical protein